MADNFIKITSNHFRVDDYIKFMRSPQFVVYMFLRNAIIRESAELVGLKNNKMSEAARRIYETYFRGKNKLVSTYSLKNLDKFLHISKANLSRYVSKLEADGFIKIHKRPTPLGMANDYEFGYYTGKFGSANYKEHYYADEYFNKLYNEIIEKQKEELNEEEYTIDIYINENKHVYDYLNIDDNWSGLSIMRAFSNKLDYITYKQCEMGRFLTQDEKDDLCERWANSNKSKTITN